MCFVDRRPDCPLQLANTRKEEIVRFSKASTDAEFAKILKARTLSPEHMETQSQLRRQIRVSPFAFYSMHIQVLTIVCSSGNQG